MGKISGCRLENLHNRSMIWGNLFFDIVVWGNVTRQYILVIRAD